MENLQERKGELSKVSKDIHNMTIKFCGKWSKKRMVLISSGKNGFMGKLQSFYDPSGIA